MAVWQFDIQLMPRGAPAPTVTADGYEIAPLPQLLVTQANSYLRQHFGEPWEMLPDWIVFGSEVGTRFDVCIDEAGSGTVHARIDARSNAESALFRVCELAILLGCVLYVPERKDIVQPSKTELERAFNQSAAVRYVRNPRAFLSEIKG